MTTGANRILTALPTFPDSGQAARWRTLRVEGLVSRPLVLSAQGLGDLPQKTLRDDFRCEEGWMAPELEWKGVAIQTVLQMAGPAESAKYVAFHAGDYAIGMPLAEVRKSKMVLALRLNGEPLAPEHGGPCRLVAAGKECYFSVKWLDLIEVTAKRPEDTGKAIALARIGRTAEGEQ